MPFPTAQIGDPVVFYDGTANRPALVTAPDAGGGLVAMNVNPGGTESVLRIVPYDASATRADSWHWIQGGGGGGNLEVINPIDFGADPTGVADSLPAFELAVTAWMTGVASGYGRMLYFPPGDYRLTDTLVIGPVAGGMFCGGGPGSRLIWDGPGGNDVLKVLSSQRVTLQDFTIWGVAGAQKPRYGVNFSYDSITFAATGNRMVNVIIDGTAATDVVETGVWLDHAFGNNSEMTFLNVAVNKFTNYGWHLSGTQQKAEQFYSCEANGGWDGTTGHAGGLIGVNCEHGSFQWFGGGIGGVSQAAFSIQDANDPFVITGCNGEEVYRFLAAGITPSSTTTSITVTSSRISSGTADHAADMVAIAGRGVFTIRDNEFDNGGILPLPYISFSPQNFVAADVRNNFMVSAGSTAQPVVVINQAGQVQCYPDVRDNIYETPLSADSVVQPEFLTVNGDGFPTFSAGVGVSRVFTDSSNRGRITIRVQTNAYTAAALSQTFAFTFPKGTALRSANILNYSGFAAPGLATATAKLGTTSGGDELLLAGDITANNVFYGAVPGDLGTAWSAPAQGRIMLADYHTAGHVYLTVTTTGANVNAVTDSLLFVELDLEVTARYVYGA